MTEEKTEAVVLRSVDFSNTSRIVTFLTPHRGKVACIARGVRRKGNRQDPLLDTLNRLEILYFWKDGRNVQQLGDIALLDSYPQMKRDLERSAFAAFPLEIVLKAIHENEPAEAPYATLVQGLAHLAVTDTPPRLAACRLALQLLTVCGFAPEMDCCVRCGNPVPPAPGFILEGGVVCRDCRHDRRLSRDAYAVLRVWCMESNLETTPAMLALHDPRPALEAELFAVVSRYAAYQLDTGFRSVRVITAMFP